MRLKFPGNGNGQDKANDGLFARDHFDNKSSLPYLQNKPETRTQMERKSATYSSENIYLFNTPILPSCRCLLAPKHQTAENQEHQHQKGI